MNKYKFGFIGCGNMGGALASAVVESGTGTVAVCDRDQEKAALFASTAAVTTTSDIAENSEFIYIAVKPQMIAALFDEIGVILRARADRFVLVSMAAGTCIDVLNKTVGIDCPIIRIMPNTPAKVGEGMIVYDTNSFVTDDDITTFLAGMSKCGVLDRIPERLIDAAGALSGCGPAFAYMFAEALADAGVECGLPRDKSVIYAAQTLLGAAEMILKSGDSPAVLKDAVCSPGGTTIVGVHALEERGFRGTVMNAVTAAYRKTAELK